MSAVEVQRENKLRLQCEFFIKKKNRKCGMTRSAKSLYCSEHDDNTSRVPCPLDPSHTVTVSKLRAHMKKCNKVRHDLSKQSKTKDIPWFCENINCQTKGREEEEEEEEEEERSKNVVGSEGALLQAIPLIKTIFQQEFSGAELPLLEMSHTDLESTERFKEITNRKHARQQSSLIQHLKHAQLWPNESKDSKKLAYIEMGCGRAEFSRYLNMATHLEYKNSPSYFLIDRAPQRLKLDSKFSSDVNTEISITRRKVDIKDLNLAPLLQGIPFSCVMISKHLCGVATDLALRCLLNTTTDESNVDGILIAMCCRHACSPHQYSNIPYIRHLISKYSVKSPLNNLSYPQFFTALIKFSSYATCGIRPDADPNQANNHFTNLSHHDRKLLGHMARRIIDEGRARFIQSYGFQTSLFRYVDNSITLEDTAILATRKPTTNLT